MHTQTHNVPQEFLQTGVTEPMSTGRHLDRLPHCLAAERTLEASLWLFQKLVIKPRHCYRFCRGFFLSALGLRVKGVNVLFDPPLTPHPLERRLFSCTAVLSQGRVHITSSSASDRSGFKRRRSSVAFFLLHPGDLTPTKKKHGPTDPDGSRSRFAALD